MSNPAVITLAHVRTMIGEFIVEDNLGEAIHLHFGEIRCDLTIREFEKLADDVGIALERFINVKGFFIDKFSAEFLFQLSECDQLHKLENICEETVSLGDIKVDTYNFLGVPTLKSIEHSRVIKALKGNTEENDQQKERNYYRVTNHQRLDTILESIIENGYPYNGKKVVLLNGSNKIYDGQHRAACMYYLWGDKEIPIYRLSFKNSSFGKVNIPHIIIHFYMDKLKKFIRKLLNQRIGVTNGIKARIKQVEYRWNRYRFKNIK